jgi:hypothetical protein
MKTRIGKIARLPKEIREQLNQRLENGELGTALIKWLNALPEVQKILAEQFASQAVRAQNLSQWRNGGYQDWLRHQHLREQTRWTTEQSKDLSSDTDSNSISIAENVALVMSAELAIHVQALGAITDPKARFRQFHLLSRELSRMRRDDQRVWRNLFHREQWRATHPPAAAQPDSEPETSGTDSQPETENPEPDSPPQLASAKPAELESVSEAEAETSAPQPETQNPKLETIEELETPPPIISRPDSEAISSNSFDMPNAHYPSIISYQLPPSPLPPNPTQSPYKKLPLPIRGRRFTCVEG